MLRECDYSQALLEQVNQAISDKTPLVIQGSNSKAFLGRPVTGQTLDVRCHRGIVNYDPTELVITARVGTPLVTIEAALESAGQMLPCEPPHYGEEATWGGMVACGLAGPRRPWSGSVRDFVLGTRIITGAGKHLRFGGEVMKNVAGYDLSRLMVGSYGCLGVLTEISMKVLPRPRASLSLRREISLQEAMSEIAEWQLQPLPISGLCYFDNALWIRLEGGEGSVKAARELLGGEEFGLAPFLPDQIHFVHSQELLSRYPDLDAKGRERAIAKDLGAVFLVGIGGKLSDGHRHDVRAPDYDDWSTPSELGHAGLNGDILVWNPVLEDAFELSSMGIRVDADTLKHQLALTGDEDRLELEWHQALLRGEMPQTIGGGIGQSRLTMLLLQLPHIGQVQCGVWPAAVRESVPSLL